MWTAAILAGGQATRLGGRDKSRLAVGAIPILARQLDLLRCMTSHVMIVTSQGRPCREASVRVVEDRIPGAGALGGLYTALMDATTDCVFVLACDMPFVGEALVTRLVEGAARAEAVVPRDASGRHPLCACYQRSVAARLRARLDAGRVRVQDALDDLRVDEVGPAELAALDPGGLQLLNVNTPDVLARARAAAR
jgi:molybdopterin-guanine dinucleotide biosynthesis protein A